MKQMTVNDALIGKIKSGDHRLYVVSDGDLVLYVGKSTDPIDRIQAHCGGGRFGWAGASLLGETIKDNLPESRTWTVTMYTLPECQTRDMDMAEQELIRVMRPCLNVSYNSNGQTLPEKYRKDDDGLLMSQAAIDAVNATAWGRKR